MEIIINKVAKRYLYDWVFKNISLHLLPSHRYAILGKNGSGKSTLLKIISGHLSPSKGTIEYIVEGKSLDKDNIYKELSFTSPYIDLIEEFTLTELVHFHQQFKPFTNKLSSDEFLTLIELKEVKNKEIRFFSSGMKQRLKLGLAICSQTSLLLLDEPTVTLDERSIQWFHHLLDQFSTKRLIIIASNEERDVLSCKKRIDIMDYK